MQESRQLLPAVTVQLPVAMTTNHNGSCGVQLSSPPERTYPLAAAAGGGASRRIRNRPSRPRPSERNETRSRSHLSNKTPEDRVREYGNVIFRCNGCSLVCQFCDKVVDPRRRSSIEYHLKSLTHTRKVALASLDKISEDGDLAEEESHRSGVGVSSSASSNDVERPQSHHTLPAATPSRHIVLDTDGSSHVLVESDVNTNTTTTAVIKLEPTDQSHSPTHDMDWPLTFGHERVLRSTTPPMTDGAISSLCETQLIRSVSSEGSVASGSCSREESAGGRERPTATGACHSCGCTCRRACNCGQGTLESKVFPNELVLKGRLSSNKPRPFVLFELPVNDLTISRLISTCSAALGVSSKLVKEVLKLPDTLLVRDKDVRRLFNYQTVELALHEHVQHVC